MKSILCETLEFSEETINFLNKMYSIQLISTSKLKVFEYLSVELDIRLLNVKGMNHIDATYQTILLTLSFLNLTKYVAIKIIARKMHVTISLFIQRGRNTSLFADIMFQERFIPPTIDHGSKNIIPATMKVSLSFILYIGSDLTILLPIKKVNRQE